MDKEDEVYIYNGMLAIKKNEVFAFYNNMGGSRGYYAKQDKSERERQVPYDFTYVWNLK